MHTRIRFTLIASLTGLAATCVQAQWASQTIALHGGWNAVYLEIQPEPRDCDTLFAGLNVESVWCFNRQIATVQFITDPDHLVPNQPDWLTYLPPADPLSGAKRLYTIEGGKPYLIKRATDAPVVNWAVRGTLVTRRIEWLSDSLNLVGFPLAPQASVTFQSFLSHTPALAGNYVYRLSASGVWVRLNTPASTLLSPGEAFWIETQGTCDYGGTLRVETERKSGLGYGRESTEERLTIRNTATTASTISLRLLTSDSPSAPGFPALAGSVPLAYWVSDPANGRVGWTNFPAQLISSNVPAGGEWAIRLAVRRRAMTAYVPPPGVTDVLYQSILEVNDGVTRLRVPVTAQAADRTGLWIGSAVLNQVSSPDDPTKVQPTSGAMQFRLIVHVDSSGTPRLLQKILQRWQNGTYKPAEDGSTNLVMDQPGRFVLLTDEAKAAQYQGAGLRDGQEVGRRVSTAGFSLHQPLALNCSNGSFGAAGAACTASVVMPYNDPLNPFVHRYHPDHDNLDDRGRPLIPRDDGRGPQTRESYTVTRLVEMHFSAEDPSGLQLAAYDDKRLGGLYRETFIGLHKNALVAEGTFQLFRVSAIGVLDP